MFVRRVLVTTESDRDAVHAVHDFLDARLAYRESNFLIVHESAVHLVSVGGGGGVGGGVGGQGGDLAFRIQTSVNERSVLFY